MDELFQRRGVWIGLAVIGLIFLCVILCALGPLLMLMPRQAVTYAPYPVPQVGQEGAAPPVYQGPGIARHGGLGPLGIVGYGFRLLFKLIFFALLLGVGLRVLRHIFWGPRHWCAPCWGPYYHGKPPTGMPGRPPEVDEAQAGWGGPPWARRAWRHHRHHWGPPPWWGPGHEQAGDEPAPDAKSAGAPDDEYTGPQE